MGAYPPRGRPAIAQFRCPGVGAGVAPPGGVADVAGTLRAARERAGLGLEEISARTRIKVAFLHALERGEFERLPGDFFARAFLRTYAREVGLSPDDVVRAYDAERQPPAPVAAEAAAPARAATQPTRLPVASGSDDIARLLRVALPIAAVIVTALVLVAISMRRDGPGEPRAVGTSGTANAPAPAARAEAEPEKLSVEIRTTGDTWIAATADGKRVAYRLFQAGDRVTLEARNELTFRVGNAGALEYRINGRQAPPVGRAGDVREFRITRETYRQLLR